MSTPTHHTLQQRWKALAPREQNLVLAASAIVALALLWWVALAPALKTLRTAPARHAALAQWLAQARSNALAVPVEARLTRSAAAAAGATPPATLGNVPAAAAPRWDGSLVLALPAR